MRRSVLAFALIVAGMLPPLDTMAQRVRLSVNCKSNRLGGAERETCASPDLIRLTADVDRATRRLERTLKGRDKEALLDTEGPLEVQRNDCDDPGVHQCVVRVLQSRLNALTAASTSPASIRSEVTRYTFLRIPYVKKWGDQLVGKRVHVLGCMVVDPGPIPAERTHGFIGETCSKTKRPYLAVVFSRMTEEQARFYDSKQPFSYWEGAVERQDGRLVLAQVNP
jgi:hypothetical protein